MPEDIRTRKAIYAFSNILVFSVCQTVNKRDLAYSQRPTESPQSHTVGKPQLWQFPEIHNGHCQTTQEIILYLFNITAQTHLATVFFPYFCPGKNLLLSHVARALLNTLWEMLYKISLNPEKEILNLGEKKTSLHTLEIWVEGTLSGKRKLKRVWGLGGVGRETFQKFQAF